MSYHPYLYGVTTSVLNNIFWLAQKGQNEAIIEEIRRMRALDEFFKEKNPKLEDCSDVFHEFEDNWK